MARPRSATVYEAGPVRVTGGPDLYRIRWMEGGSERGGKSRTLEDAIRRADGIAGRLALAGSGAISGATAYGALAEAWVRTRGPEWSAGHHANVAAILYGHVLPVAGRIACERVTEEHLLGVCRTMVADGYSADWIAQGVRTMRALGRWGVRRGVWTPLSDPAAELKAPSPSRLVDRRLVPSAALIAELRRTVRDLAPNQDQALRREWMVVAAAGCGLRFSEATALTPEHVDLETREVSVVQAWNRQRTGPPRLGEPKSRHSVRRVVIPQADVGLWRAVMDATEAGAHLGTTQRGRLWRSPGWKQRVWDDATAEVEGWPERAGFHALRHAAIIGWLDRGMRPGNVARLAGHHSAAFTLGRYVGAETDHLDRARELL